MTIRIGVDIGGTFTDLVAQRADGRLHILKVASSEQNPGDAVVSGLEKLLTEVGASMDEISDLVHGTTVGSNTILQKRGALTGLITTRGFRDILEIARIRTPVMFDLTWRKPEPLALRRYRLEVTERIGADGAVVTDLNDAEVLAAGQRLLDDGVQAVAICFLNSYVNDLHERRALRVLKQAYPSLRICASCDVLPEIKEYERTSTTVVNAYLLKSMGDYLENLSKRLTSAGLRVPLRVVSSHGTMVSAQTAASTPVLVVGSGPAAGVIGSAKLMQAHQEQNRSNDAIAFDLGGTTAKASLIEDGLPAMTSEYEFRDGISTPSRFVKGGGYMLKVPAIDIAEVGAGGGSMAWIDSGGLLRVGPESAGATPGPACYGLGNDRPTVTDANLLLGYLNPTALAGGSLGINPALARDAIEKAIATPLGLSITDAAHGIRHLANLEMARAIRTVTVERGRDTRQMTLVAYGGGGPVHAVEVAQSLGIERIVIPPMSGVFCSLGMLSAPTGRQFVRSIMRGLDQIGADEFSSNVQALHEQAAPQMQADGLTLDAAQITYQLDLRYFGQSSEVVISYQPEMSEADIKTAFNAAYQQMYNHATQEAIEVVNLRLSANASADRLLDFDNVKMFSDSDQPHTPPHASRQAWFASANDYIDTPVYDRAALSAGLLISGPAIIEAYDTTIVLQPHSHGRVDSNASLIIEVQP